MPRQKVSKSKKPGKVGGFFKNINYKSPKTHLLIVVLVFSVVGGGIMIYSTFAASWPPAIYSGYNQLATKKGTDGVMGSVNCVSVYGKTVFGPIANCIQTNPNNKNLARVGFYSPLTDKFSEQSGWVEKVPPVPGTVINKKQLCKNMDFVFVGTDTLKTPFGESQFGQIYRYDGFKSKWQIKWANLSKVNGNCYVSSDAWMDVKGW